MPDTEECTKESEKVRYMFHFILFMIYLLLILMVIFVERKHPTEALLWVVIIGAGETVFYTLPESS